MEAGGLTDMGAAFSELESKLSRSAFLASSTGAYAPVIILLSDGCPTDEWEKGLEKLKYNNWYKAATKIAIAVDDGDTSVLSAFTGTTESVLQVNSNRDDLKKLCVHVEMRSLAVISSTMNSRPVAAGSGEDSSGENNAIKVADEVKNDANLWGGGW